MAIIGEGVLPRGLPKSPTMPGKLLQTFWNCQKSACFALQYYDQKNLKSKLTEPLSVAGIVYKQCNGLLSDALY